MISVRSERLESAKGRRSVRLNIGYLKKTDKSRLTILIFTYFNDAQAVLIEMNISREDIEKRKTF